MMLSLFESKPGQTMLRAPASLLLQRQCACGDASSDEAEKTGKLLQAKSLTVNRPGDRFEQEADRVAEQVTSPRAPLSVQPAGASPVQVQRAGQDAAGASAPPPVHEVLDGPGQSLDPTVRTSMEKRFGHDFSRVRIHTGDRAAESARSVHSLAYTVGPHVVFGAGQYAPHTPGGQRLLAHELTHVLQQGSQAGRLQRYGMDNAPYGDPRRDARLREHAPSGPRSIEVTAIDDVDAVGWVESFLSLGEVNFTDLTSMVTNILTALGSNRMSRLNIQVHGSPFNVSFGTTSVNVGNFATHQPTLARLAGHFASGGFVHLRACNVGQNLPLMRLFAAAFGVTVYAGRGYQNNIFGVNTGFIVRCEPNGTCTEQFFQP